MGVQAEAVCPSLPPSPQLHYWESHSGCWELLGGEKWKVSFLFGARPYPSVHTVILKSFSLSPHVGAFPCSQPLLSQQKKFSSLVGRTLASRRWAGVSSPGSYPLTRFSLAINEVNLHFLFLGGYGMKLTPPTPACRK